nr:ComEC/Rec2 family competence protein [Pseudomonadota bacterium]
RLPGGAGGGAGTLATGDKGSIPEGDADAMRRAGLAHLLAVSGLHLSAVVGTVMLVVTRLLALSPWLALRTRLPLVAAGAGAVAAIGYTLLTGAAVPTIRACVAALLVLAAIVMGRQALTLRLVATGALIVLLLYPESITGPSFQLSFAAVTTIVALHEHPGMRRWFGAREEPRWRRIARGLLSLLFTGLAVELTLMPIALYHFHKAGIYGALANVAAIPLTTLIVMPLEAVSLLFDGIGLGAPVWWLTRHALDLLLWIAHTTANAPGSVAMLPSMPGGAYALMVAGGIWSALWRTRWRRLGMVPLAIGAVWAAITPAPDLLVTGDGRHAALRTIDGGMALLRDRTGDYTADMMAENGGIDDLPVLLSDQPNARCSRDACIADRKTGTRTWRILATRSSYMVPADQLAQACSGVDIVISDRRLPRGCTPRWLRLDSAALATTGGVAITLGAVPSVRTVRETGDEHPWVSAPRSERHGGQRSAWAGGRHSPWHAGDGAKPPSGDRRSDPPTRRRRDERPPPAQ